MKNYIKVFTIAIIGFAFAACETYDFESEQYKNVVNLLSNSAQIYDRQVSSLRASGDTIFLVAGLSGTTHPNQSFNVALVEGDSLFHAFNKSNYDIDSSRFARWLPAVCYTFPNTQMDIPVGQNQVRFPIYLKNLDKLSPDSIYLLDYKLDTKRTKDFNPLKKEVLLRIYKENEFASTYKNTYYNYTTTYVETLSLSDRLVRRPTNANQIFPLGENSVRMLAGDETFGDYKGALDDINAKSINVTVGEQTPQNPLARHATVESYKTLDVVQMPPYEMYNNTYLINILTTPDGRSTYYKEFRLHYKYRLNPTLPYKEVKAILRMEYSPRAEQL